MLAWKRKVVNYKRVLNIVYKTYAFKYCQYALVSKYIYLQYGISLEPQTPISIGQISFTILLSNEYLKLAYPKLYLNRLPKVVLSLVYSISYNSDYNIANSYGDLGIIFTSFFFSDSASNSLANCITSL